MTRFLLGLVLFYGAVDWIERDSLWSAALCVLLGAGLMLWAVHDFNLRFNDDQDFGP